MDRRSFLRHGSCGMAALMLSRPTLAQNFSSRSNAEGLQTLENKPLEKIAFGSCNQSYQDQKYWQLIGRDQPDLWIWLGDNIYGNEAPMDERIRQYLTLKDNSYYREFRQTVPVIGTWDDHDFATNNSNGTFADKAASKKALLNFLDVGPAAEVWDHTGVYQSFVFGPPGQQTHIIMLDLRYNMNPGLSIPRILGPDQWHWLQEEVRTSTSDLILIGSSLNVMSPWVGLGLEGWAQFGAERRQLYELLASTGIPTVILSGDRHYADISRKQLDGGLPVYEFMSSGLTHADGVNIPHSDQLMSVPLRKNYGVLAIDWSSQGPKIRMQIHSAEQYGTMKELVASF